MFVPISGWEIQCSIACTTRIHVLPKSGLYMASRFLWSFWIALKWQFQISSSVLKALFLTCRKEIPRNIFLKTYNLWELYNGNTFIDFSHVLCLACERTLKITIILNVGKIHIIELVCVCDTTGDTIWPELRSDISGLQSRRNLQCRSNSFSVCMPTPKCCRA